MAKSEREKQRQAEEEEKKQRKKKAKQEATLMLELEGLRKEVKKAEQRVSKAQAGLESAQVLTQRIEGQLAELRGTGKKEEEAAGTQEVPQAVQTEVEGADQAAPGEDSERDRGEVPSEEQVEGPPPVEGRVDITEQAETQESAASVEEPVVITSGGGSMEVESSDEHAWPPPEIREEIVEAVKEEVLKDESEQAGGGVVEEQHEVVAEEPVVITSGEGSIEIESSDEHAWPPPEVREEVAEAVKEESGESTGTEEEEDVSEVGTNGETAGAPRTRRRSPRRPRATS